MGLPNAEFSEETMMTILIRGYFTASKPAKVGQARVGFASSDRALTDGSERMDNQAPVRKAS